MKKSNTIGILYFIVHLMVEICSFYVLTSYIQSEFVWILMLIYDFLAFVPQGFFGFLRDRGIRINFAFIGTMMTSLALVMMTLSLDPFLVILVLSVGNSIVHVQGAELTLRQSKGQMTPAALFVAGGSFGVITGKLLCGSGAAAPIMLGFNLLTFIPIIIAQRLSSGDGTENLERYNFANTKFSPYIIIALATFVVAVRSFMGYGIPTSWNKTVIQNIILYSSMGLGKTLGGVLIDKIGIRKTALISTVGALPFLLCGSELMTVSLIGVTFFSMTMAVTLALIVSVMKKYPGVAFGFTTVGLFLGTVPVFFVRIRSMLVNCIIISVLTVVCVIILTMICAKKKSDKRID